MSVISASVQIIQMNALPLRMVFQVSLNLYTSNNRPGWIYPLHKFWNSHLEPTIRKWWFTDGIAADFLLTELQENPGTPPCLLPDHRVQFILSVQFSSVAQSCPTLCDPMNCSTPGLPVYHQLPEFTQTHVHRVGDAIQPSHPLSSPSPPAPNPSQHQGLFH